MIDKYPFLHFYRDDKLLSKQLKFKVNLIAGIFIIIIIVSQHLCKNNLILV